MNRPIDTTHTLWRSRWAAVGAALAVAVGASTGVLTTASATVSSGERNVFMAITPCRLFDTRPGAQVGPRSSPLGSNDCPASKSYRYPARRRRDA